MLRCFITNRLCSPDETISGGQIRRTLFDYIKSKYPDFSQTSHLSQEALNQMRSDYVASLIEDEEGDLTAAEKEVAKSIGFNEILSEDVEEEEEMQASFGERMADRVADFGGSWTFIFIFFFILLAWIFVNVYFLGNKGYDPYPFILLNLILSCLAAVQAPIIMMSQNRQDAKDRARSQHDYKVNLKAELEIRLLHEKIDHLLMHEQKRLFEIQQVQIELMQSLEKTIRDKARADPGAAG